MEANDSDSEKDKVRAQLYPGERNYKSYHKILRQLLTEYKPTIDRFLPHAQIPSNQKQIQLVNQCPSIAEHICVLLDGRLMLKKQVHHQILQELKEYTKKKTAKMLFEFPPIEADYYQTVATQSQAMVIQFKKKKKPQQLEWTGQRMLVLDIISIFFKFNNVYRKIYKINKPIITRKILTQIFGIRESELEPISVIFQYYVPVIKYEYSKDFEQLVVLFAIVELKSRIYNFQRKIGGAKVRNTVIVNMDDEADGSKEDKEDAEVDQEMYFLQREDYQYRFCEIAYLPQPQSKETTIETLNPYLRAQVKQSIERIVEISSLYQQKRQLLKLKIRYRVSFFSLMICFEDRKEKFIEPQYVSAQTLLNLKVCQWLFLKPISLIQALEIATKSRISPGLLYKNNSLVMISYCTLAMKRLSLHTNVLKAHEKIDRVLQRKSIYVCQFRYFLSQFQPQYVSNENNQVFTVIIATNGSEIVFAAAYKKQVCDYQYFRIIKSAIPPLKHEQLNIVVYLSNHQGFEWLCLKRLFSLRQGSDIRIYFATYPEHFHIHLMADFLIRLLISESKQNNNSFILAAEISSSIVMSSLHYVEEVKQILYNLYSKDYHPIQDYSSLQIPFGEEQIRARIRKAYQIFIKQSFPMWKSELIWLNGQSLQEGKIYYFNNDKKHPQTRLTYNIGQKKKMQKYLQNKSKFFVDKYVQQMKWRHPYLSQQQKQEMRENLHHFLQKRRMGVKDLAKKFRHAVRFLVCYQAYFNEMLLNKQIEQFDEELSAEISFLKKIYEEQTSNLNNTYKGEIIQYCEYYFCVDLKTGERVKPYKRVIKKAQLLEQQDPQNNKNKANFLKDKNVS